jgi:hypothetical protein
MKKFRLWWMPQVPMDPFYYNVKDPHEAAVLYDCLAKYDLFQYENKVKPDFSNAGGLEVFEKGEWVEWENEYGDTLSDIIDELLEK